MLYDTILCMLLTKACSSLQGYTALHTASATHHRGMPELLLSLGANPNVQDVEVCLLAMAQRLITPIQALSSHLVQLCCLQQLKPAACLMCSPDALLSRCSVYNQFVYALMLWPSNSQRYVSSLTKRCHHICCCYGRCYRPSPSCQYKSLTCLRIRHA